jgi:RHS repeat-associated protein
VYFGAVEIRNWQIAGQEQVITYPHPAVRLVNGFTITAASYLHRDALGSVRAITDAAGVKVESAFYKPFGEQTKWLSPAAPAPEAKGWIGERYDASAGLQYLNARYYDPELGMFIQPDWFEVTEPGVGRNRYSYSFNDPVNGRDPGGDLQRGAHLLCLRRRWCPAEAGREPRADTGLHCDPRFGPGDGVFRRGRDPQLADRGAGAGDHRPAPCGAARQWLHHRAGELSAPRCPGFSPRHHRRRWGQGRERVLQTVRRADRMALARGPRAGGEGLDRRAV